MNKIVISAVNLIEGGPLTVLQNCLEILSKYSVSKNIEVIAIVHNKKLCFYPNITYIEIPWAKKSWFHRIYCEYFYFKKISKQLKPYLWLSLHDISPNVESHLKAVYCHNPTPFYKAPLSNLRYNYKEVLFSIFYKYLYQINIKKNTHIIVQQNWLREEFAKIFSLDKKKIIVALPKYKRNEMIFDNVIKNKVKTFFYPAFPRTFKNFEVICNACEILEKENINGFKILLTLKGNENKYAKYIYKKYSHLNNIVFQGLLPIEKVYEVYQNTDCLIFPSKLETWGLPISEFSPSNRPMLIANLPYAHETSAGSSLIQFFNSDNATELARMMKEVIDNNLSNFTSIPMQNIENPKTTSWEMLFNYILQKND